MTKRSSYPSLVTRHPSPRRVSDSSCSRLTAYGLRLRAAFTLVEVLVAVAILAIALGAMGVIFRMSLDAYRASSATAEIMRKLRAITEQLNTDFKGLRKDGIIFSVWGVKEDSFHLIDYDDETIPLPYKYHARRYHRVDKILFFSNGDFQTYDDQKGAGVTKAVRGNLARISYMIANDGDGTAALDYAGMTGYDQKAQRDMRRRTRILARSQHIVTADPCFTDTAAVPLVAFPCFSKLDRVTDNATALDLAARNNAVEFDSDGMAGWNDAPIEDFTALWQPGLFTMASACLDVSFPDTVSGTGTFGRYGGLRVDPANPQDMHLMLCQGVADFQIQFWNGDRWWPETGYIDPNTGDISSDTDFETDDVDGTGHNVIDTEWGWYNDYHPSLWGPDVLKFTFTLYDSRGFFKEGRTFTHIVYLDK